jgi:SEC-C motif
VGADAVAGGAAGGVGGADEDLRVNGKKIGRNEPCLCGSGKKFKVCCTEARLAEERQRRDRESTRGRGQRDVVEHSERYGGAPLTHEVTPAPGQTLNEENTA